jgi:mannose/fructose-specific phosphotransferase system component IIA
MTGSRPFALLVTHGVLGEELVRTVGSILGPQTDTITISNNGLSSDALTAAIEERISAIPSDAPVVLFTDLAAGSCGIASRRITPCDRPFKRITGVNLPMLLEFFHYRDTLSLDELLPRMEAKAKAGILVL